ncbi:unnamed protein product [Rotaria sp. Silwood1]|nr:unnamed protein product [Rotaria sp. Silwood1]
MCNVLTGKGGIIEVANSLDKNLMATTEPQPVNDGISILSKRTAKLKLAASSSLATNKRYTELFVDTGIRSGTDVLKALALGARAVFIGRPILYGLASGGQDGVRRVLDILKRELVYDMACCGLTSIDQINKEILYKH